MSTQGLRPFARTLTPEAGDSAYNTSAKVATLVEANKSSGNFAKIWQLTIPAQTGARWGYGDPRFQFNQGVMTFAAVDESVANGFNDGELEFRVTNAAETLIVIQARLYSGLMHASSYAQNAKVATVLQNNRQDIPPFPEQGDFVFEDSKLQLWFKTVANAATTTDQVQFRLPATVYSA